MSESGCVSLHSKDHALSNSSSDDDKENHGFVDVPEHVAENVEISSQPDKSPPKLIDNVDDDEEPPKREWNDERKNDQVSKSAYDSLIPNLRGKNLRGKQRDSRGSNLVHNQKVDDGRKLFQEY